MRNTVYFTRYLWILLYTAVMLLLSWSSLFGEDASVGLCIGFLFFALLGLFVFFIQPYACTFDEGGFTIRYFFGFRERGLWKDVKNVYVMVDLPRSRQKICGFLMWGTTEGKKAFFTQSKIPYNRQVRNLVRNYWEKDFNI